MENFTNLQHELGALYAQHFQVTSTTTQRQDQWYKRSKHRYDGPIREPIIITPRKNQEEWVPAVLQFAAAFEAKFEAASQSPAHKRHIKEIKSLPREGKLFVDDVLDCASTNLLCQALVQKPALEPAMQQVSWWTVDAEKSNERYRRLKGIRALVCCGQTDALLRLSLCQRTLSAKDGPLIDEAHWRMMTVSWDYTIADILELLLFFSICSAFPEMAAGEKYKQWASLMFDSSGSACQRYLEVSKGKMPTTPTEIEQGFSMCVNALLAAQLWSAEAEVRSVNWRNNFIDAFLFTLGFEGWNRVREGEGYLGCDLNFTKDSSWLRSLARVSGRWDGSDVEYNREATLRASKPVDPLKLREPKQEVTLELDVEAQRQMAELSVLETQEEEYGRRRSTKYAKRCKN